MHATSCLKRTFSLLALFFSPLLVTVILKCVSYILGLPDKWTVMTDAQKEQAIFRLLDTIDVSVRSSRKPAVRSVLYLVQGVFGECFVLETQAQLTRTNVFLLYKYGMFQAFVQLLNMEIE